MSQFRPQSFSLLPPVVKNLLIINVLMYLLTVSDLTLDFGFNMKEHLSLFHWRSSLFKPWQFITYMFMHADVWHMVFNMFGLWMFGYTIENLWGSKRFLNFYLITGVGSAVFFLITKEIQLVPLIENINPEVLDQICNTPFGMITTNVDLQPISQLINTPMLGASGAVYAILMAYGLTFPNSVVHLYFLIPVKMKWFITGLIVYSIFREATGSQDGIAHLAHLGGMLIGYLLIRYWKGKNYLY